MLYNEQDKFITASSSDFIDRDVMCSSCSLHPTSSLSNDCYVCVQLAPVKEELVFYWFDAIYLVLVPVVALLLLIYFSRRHFKNKKNIFKHNNLI